MRYFRTYMKKLEKNEKRKSEKSRQEGVPPGRDMLPSAGPFRRCASRLFLPIQTKQLLFALLFFLFSATTGHKAYAAYFHRINHRYLIPFGVGQSRLTLLFCFFLFFIHKAIHLEFIYNKHFHETLVAPFKNV